MVAGQLREREREREISRVRNKNNSQIILEIKRKSLLESAVEQFAVVQMQSPLFC